MATEKISQLPTVTNASVGSSSIVPLVDSASSTTKTMALTQWDLRYFTTALISALGDIVYGTGAGALAKLTGNVSATPSIFTQTGTGSASAAPAWRPFLPPYTVVYYTGSGTWQTLVYFQISSGNATTGATYTNNGYTFTVVTTASSATLLFTTCTGFPTSSGTLTKSGGTGDATITFQAYASPLWMQIEMVGGGGGGGASGGGTVNIGTVGGQTSFAGATAPGGSYGNSNSPTAGAGGTAGSLNGFSGFSLGGGVGFCGVFNGPFTTSQPAGGGGGNGAFGGAGYGGPGGNNGSTATANTGAGGGGAGAFSSSYGPAGGGGAGAYTEVYLASPGSTYTYTVGGGGNGGTASGGASGGSGAAGVIIITSGFQ